MRPITERQAQVLEIIAESIERNGHAPTQEAIGRRLGINKSTVNEHIRALIRKGRLEREGRTSLGLAGSEHAVLLLQRECTLMARLAADTPQFDNPLEVMEAKRIRDKWLAAAGIKAVQS